MNSFFVWFWNVCQPKGLLQHQQKCQQHHTQLSTVNTFSIQVKINETFLNLRRYALEWNHERIRVEFSTLVDKIHEHKIHCILLTGCFVCSLTHSNLPVLCVATISPATLRSKTHGTDSLYACIRYFIPYFLNVLLLRQFQSWFFFFFFFGLSFIAASTYKSGESAFIIHIHNNHIRNKTKLYNIDCGGFWEEASFGRSFSRVYKMKWNVQAFSVCAFLYGIIYFSVGGLFDDLLTFQWSAGAFVWTPCMCLCKCSHWMRFLA